MDFANNITNHHSSETMCTTALWFQVRKGTPGKMCLHRPFIVRLLAIWCPDHSFVTITVFLINYMSPIIVKMIIMSCAFYRSVPQKSRQTLGANSKKSVRTTTLLQIMGFTNNLPQIITTMSSCVMHFFKLKIQGHTWGCVCIVHSFGVVLLPMTSRSSDRRRPVKCPVPFSNIFFIRLSLNLLSMCMDIISRTSSQSPKKLLI